MKRLLVTLLLTAVALVATSGCTTTASRARATTANFVAERGAPTALVANFQRGARLSLADIEQLAVLKVPDDVTLAYLRDTGTAYQLTTWQIARMHDAGVSDRVIDYLLATPDRAVVRPRGNFAGRIRGGLRRGHIGHSFGNRGFGATHRGRH
ncbi:MAG: hypothetical protein NTV51_11555 [Verrucomicrobia bacterium]|nr:hypothetical protein [Verrucomicrobiota bacterium]